MTHTIIARSVKEVAAAVADGHITREQGIARCDEMLARDMGKFRKAAWSALRGQLTAKRKANGDAAWKAAQAAMPAPKAPKTPKPATGTKHVEVPAEFAEAVAAFVTWMQAQ